MNSRRLLRVAAALGFLCGIFLSPAKALDAGENVTITLKWQDQNSAEYPMNGVKVTVKDKLVPGGAADIEGYAIGGTFTFTVPRTGYTYDVILTADFPGVNASGNVVAAGGAGAFTVLDDTTGLVQTEAAGSNIVSYTSVKGGTNVLQGGDLWPVLHGMADMIREARRRLSISKNAFTVRFPSTSGTSRFSSASNTIFILLLDRYDWDVVGHEFGHAVASEANAVNSFAGGKHDGSNQYTHAPNAGTLGDKSKSLNLAFNEAFGTWIGGALLERSDFKGKFPRVGDGKYSDTEDSSIDSSYEDNTTQAFFGDDTENAGYGLLFDLQDSANEANKRTTKIPGLRDRTSLGLVGMWNILNGSAAENISDFWKAAFLPGKVIAPFLPGTGSTVNDPAALQKALNAAETFAEFGVAPLLFKPDRGSKVELTPAVPPATNPKFEWSQEATKTVGGAAQAGAHADLKLNKFQLVIYSNDLKTQLFHKDGLVDVFSYTLTDADLTALKTQVDALKTAGTEIASVKAAIIADSDVKAPATGPYLSNGVELLIQDFNRAVVAVVDSSGSNTSTDPTNQRVVASKQSIRNLVSQADAALDPAKVPDIAAAVDFDSSVSVLSNFADPDSVEGTLNSIDSSGGTSIDGGLNQAINMLDSINVGGFLSFVRDRASILLFTDGQNNSGDGPVIAAIANATAKGYRVHYGFLNPFYSPIPATAPLAAAQAAPEFGEGNPPTIVSAPTTIAAAAPAPTTIQEAVLQSGGVFGIISNADSQFAFVQQVFSRGLTNNDEDNAPGGKIVGQTASTEQLQDDTLEAAFEFSGSKNEVARVIVRTDEFQAAVTVYDRDGNILGFEIDTDGDDLVEIPLTLPYTGRYTLQVYSNDGRTGEFTAFVDVQNARFTYVRVGTEEELYERLASTSVDFSPAALAKYYGLATPTIGETRGTFTIKVGKDGKFSAVALLDGVRVPIKGTLDATGFFTGAVTSKVFGALTVTLQLTATAEGNKIEGTIEGAAFTVALAADASAYSKKLNPAAAAGNYTFILPSETDPTIPGDGYGVVVITADGKVRLAGSLGDSRKLTFSTTLSQESTFVLNLPIYKVAKGDAPDGIYGEIAARDSESGDLDGLLDWTKPENARDKLYPDGFSGTVPFIGSRYVKRLGQRILILDDTPGNLRVSFGGGGLVPIPGERVFSVDAKNKAVLAGPDVEEKLKLSFNSANGLFGGSFPSYASGKPKAMRFKGAVLQSQNKAAGHFIGSGQTGFVFLDPFDDAALRVTSAARVKRTVGDFLSYTITGVNGVATRGVSGLPTGLFFSTFSGNISGTLNTAGIHYFTVSVSDNAGRTATQSVALEVAP